MNKTLDIILPCYNPPKDWEQNLLKSFNKIRENIHSDIGIILVNDGSEEINYQSIEKLKNNIPGFKFIN